MRSMRSRIPEKSELAAQLKRYRYDAGLKGDEAGASSARKATTVYKYEAGTVGVAGGPASAAQRVRREHGHGLTEIGDPRAGGRKKDESALRWRKMRTYYDMMNPAKQRTLLDVARAMAEDSEPCACAHQRTGIYAHAHISIARICAARNLGICANQPCAGARGRTTALRLRRLVLGDGRRPHGMGVGVDPMLPGLGVVVLGEAVGGMPDVLERAAGADEVAAARWCYMPHGRLDIEPGWNIFGIVTQHTLSCGS